VFNPPADAPRQPPARKGLPKRRHARPGEVGSAGWPRILLPIPPETWARLEAHCASLTPPRRMIHVTLDLIEAHLATLEN